MNQRNGMMLRRIVLAFAAIGVMSSPGSAQIGPISETGSHIRVRTKPVDPERRGEVIRNVGKCMYNLGRRSVDPFLMFSDPVTIDYAQLKTSPDKLVRQFSIEDCLTRDLQLTDKSFALSLNPIQIRTMLMEQAYLANFAGPALLPATLLPPRVFVSRGDNLARAQVVAEFSDCLVAKDAAGADAILRTRPTTLSEKAAARALGGALGACLVTGQKISFTPASVRAMATEGLWRRYVQQSPVALPSGTRTQ